MMVRGAVLGAGGALAFMAALAACGDSKRGGNGAECFVASDCVAPLVCVQRDPKDKGRICTDNLDSVVGEPPELPPEAAAPMADGGGEGGARSDAGPQDSGQTPADTSTGGDP
jgi:hypothetical protein